MLSNINMELIQAFNPLYAVPIVAVIFCALIVYTLGFKSPIQPPSFEGLEEDKKSSKKRKTKEVQKQNKVVTNGKVNGVATTKGKVQEIPKKKEIVDNNVINEKPKSTEKTSADKKAAKKSKPQNEKQEKKKENVTEDLNDDGWVQHVSKKGKKNRKKEEVSAIEVPSNSSQSPIKKTVETSDVDVAEKMIPNPVEVTTDENKEIPEEKPLKKSSKKEAASVPSPEKPVKLEIAVEVKSDENDLEHDSKQPSTNIPTVSEDTSKSKKKKKKQGTTAPVVETNSITSPPPVEIVTVPSITDAPLATSKISEPVIDNVPVSVPDDSKTNVVFDELAGLYPEAKEKKKKKVRRDH